jgi:hypothetical protein
MTMSDETQKITDYLARSWQAPAASPAAVPRILQAAAATSQLSARAPGMSRAKPMMVLAAAASVALVMVWSGMMPKTGSPVLVPATQSALLDDDALTYVFSNQSTEELL